MATQEEVGQAKPSATAAEYDLVFQAFVESNQLDARRWRQRAMDAVLNHRSGPNAWRRWHGGIISRALL